MKLLIASDIHGAAQWCARLMDAIDAEQPDRVVLLGDLLYHGPRNDLPADYAPKEVVAMLNGIADRVICVRGNCEAEVDQMVLHFPVMADYAIIPNGRNIIYVTHGHHASEQTPPPLKEGDILLHGHTHVPKCVSHENFVYMNPGSVSIPKENSPRSYMIYDDGVFEWKRLDDGSVYMRADLRDGQKHA